MFGNPRFLLDQETSKPVRPTVTLARFARYFKPFWPALLLVAILVVISTWMQVTTPDITGQLVDCYLTPTAASASGGNTGGFNIASGSETNCWLAQKGGGFTRTIVKGLITLGGLKAPSTDPASMTNSARLAGLARIVILLVGFYVAGAILGGLSFFSMTWAGQHVLRSLRVAVFEHLHRLPMSYYSEHEAGDLMSRITNDTEAIGQAVNFALLNVIGGILLMVWIAYNMLTRNLAFALLSMLITPLMAIATVWFSDQARKAFRRSRKELGAVNAELQENISAVREVQAFNRAEENIEQFKTVNAANRDANVKAVAFTSALNPALEAFGYIALMIVTVVGGSVLIGNGKLAGTTVSLGLVITFLGYVTRFNQPIQQIAVLWSNIQNAIAGGERIFSLLDTPPDLQDAPDALPISTLAGKVEFDNVCASYKPGQSVLEHVSFTAEPGQTVAIVGPTGAGKTTIINLIPRFYDVCEGSIKVDGMDVRQVTAESLRKQIGIVLQDTFLFSTTVMDNIRFGKPDATDEEVVAAARLAHADTFIERLPDKYQTVLGERGSGLSQGQRQLLAIARAALADPRILILDEATSSVDSRTERLIQEALEKLLEGRTSFVIAHRLSTIRNADQVLVVHDGHIIERGKFNELLAQKGFFYNLYMSQFRRDPQFLEAITGNGHKPNLEDLPVAG